MPRLQTDVTRKRRSECLLRRYICTLLEYLRIQGNIWHNLYNVWQYRCFITSSYSAMILTRRALYQQEETAEVVVGYT